MLVTDEGIVGASVKLVQPLKVLSMLTTDEGNADILVKLVQRLKVLSMLVTPSAMLGAVLILVLANAPSKLVTLLLILLTCVKFLQPEKA